jgi:hypothetical protein
MIAERGHYFGEIPVRELVGKIPTDAQYDYLGIEMTASEELVEAQQLAHRVPEGRAHARRAALAWNLDRIASAPAPRRPGDDRVFPMTAWNACDRARHAARTAGLEMQVSPHFLAFSAHSCCAGAI